MTTIVPFVPSPTAPMQFGAPMDGLSRTVSVPYNIFGQRFYTKMTDTDGALIFALPQIGSPMSRLIEAMSWHRGKLDITLVRRHGYDIGQTVALTVSGCKPEVLNARWSMLAEDDRKLAFFMPDDPGAITKLGAISHDINIAAGYFGTSTLVFREVPEQYEVNP